MRKKTKYIITEYRIRNRKTGRFVNNIGSVKYSVDGRSWDSKYSLYRDVQQDVRVMVEHPEHGWLLREDWGKVERTPGMSLLNFPCRKETIKEVVNRKFDDDIEVIEILIDEKMNAKVNTYPILDFMYDAQYR